VIMLAVDEWEHSPKRADLMAYDQLMRYPPTHRSTKSYITGRTPVGPQARPGPGRVQPRGEPLERRARPTSHAWWIGVSAGGEQFPRFGKVTLGV